MADLVLFDFDVNKLWHYPGEERKLVGGMKKNVNIKLLVVVYFLMLGWIAGDALDLVITGYDRLNPARSGNIRWSVQSIVVIVITPCLRSCFALVMIDWQQSGCTYVFVRIFVTAGHKNADVQIGLTLVANKCICNCTLLRFQSSRKWNAKMLGFYKV